MQTSPSLSHTHTHTHIRPIVCHFVLSGLWRGFGLRGLLPLLLPPNPKISFGFRMWRTKKKKLQEKSEFEILRNRKETGHGNQELCWTSQCTVVKRKMGLCCQRPAKINLSGAHYRKNIEQATGTSIWQWRVTVTSTHNRNLD